MSRQLPRHRAPTKAELRQAAQSWEAWLRGGDKIGRYGGQVDRPPHHLDWQRNTAAAVPPGFIWVRCLCFSLLVRPPSFHGQVRSHVTGAIVRTVGPAVTVGDPCPTCGAPLQRIVDRDDPYPWPFDLHDPAAHPLSVVPSPPPPPARPLSDLMPVPALPGAGISVSSVVSPTTPAPGQPARRWTPRFPSMEAEKAWVAAERRAGRLP